MDNPIDRDVIIAELVTALRALVGRENAGKYSTDLYNGDVRYECIYCTAMDYGEWGTHRAMCPIVKGRELLEKIEKNLPPLQGNNNDET